MKRLCLLLAPALLLCPSSLAAKEGTVTLQLNHIFGLTTTGFPKPSANRLCRAKFRHLAGSRATTTYKIDPHTLWESGQTTFRSTTYQLYALGNAGEYDLSYFQDGHGHTPPIYAINFTISLQFTHPHTKVDLLLDENTNCQLTDKNVAGSP